MKRILARVTVLAMVMISGLTFMASSKDAHADEVTEATEATTATATQTTTKGEKVTAYAKKYVGNKYVFGGSSLTRGTDCSGFTMKVFRKFGKKLPHSSSAQRRVGKKVKGGIKNAKAGDLICYSGHVAIYLGNNKIVHASNSAPYPRGGIKISSNAKYRKIVCVRRVVK